MGFGGGRKLLRIMCYLEDLLRKFYHLFLGKTVSLYLRIHGCKVGRDLKCKSFPNFDITPRGNIRIGNHVRLGRGVTLQVAHNGILELGDHVLLTNNIVISAQVSVILGDYSGAAENTSIRDADHVTVSKDTPSRWQGDVIEPVEIGKNVALGSQCVIMRGVRIPDGVILGPSSIISKNTRLQENGIYFGSPLRLLKVRE